MAEYTGSALVVKFGGTVLTSDFRTFRTSEEAGEVDATAGADARKVYLSAPIDGEATITCLDLTGSGTVLWPVVMPGQSGSLEWAPEGTAGGKPRNYCNARSLTRNREVPYDGVVSYEARWRLSGDITAGTY